MIIESISLKNFQCYFGEHSDNAFFFKEGLNLIIGNNGSGKSKLFDAFFWVIYDQIFDSVNRKFVSTSQFQEKLISAKAKALCGTGGSVSVEVILRAKSSQDRRYRFTRILKATKNADGTWSCDNKSRLLVDEFKVTAWQSISESQHPAVLDTVIPKHLKPYMWFQGEQVDSLMNLTDKDALTRIINLISRIQVYDDLILLVSRGETKATKDFRAAQMKLSKNQVEFRAVEARLDNVKNGIQNITASLDGYERNLQYAKDCIDDLMDHVGNAEKRAEIKEAKVLLEADIGRNNAALEEIFKSLHKNLFTNSWILRNAQSYFGDFGKKYTDYFVEHSRVINLANAVEIKLPINIPQPIHVHQMLNDETCYVCGRDAKKGSAEYEHIESLLLRDERKEESLFKYDCSTYFRELYDNGLGFKKHIERIDEDISHFFRDIEKIRKALKESQAKLTEIKKEYGASLDGDESHNIVKAFRVHEANREKYQGLVNGAKEQVAAQLEKEKQLKVQLDDLAKSSGGKIDPETEIAYEVFQKLYGVVRDVKNEVFESLISELEESANEFFVMMTRDNTAVTGHIRINCYSHTHCVAQIVDSDGEVLTNPNDSNLVLVKLALIMAVIRSRGKWSDNYAFITDAPTSKMAAEYSNGFYKTIGTSFKQAIVTTYDFVKPDERGALNSFNVSKAYLIAPEYLGSKSEEPSDLSISITELS